MADTMLNLRNYSSLFLNDRGRLDTRYSRVTSDADFLRIAPLGGNPESIDTSLEIALLSNAVGVIDVRSVEANNLIGNARQADLKLGAAVFQEIQILRFIGNTAAVGRYEGELRFITDRGNVTRAEVETFYRNGIRGLIAEIVDEEFNRINVALYAHNAVLTRNPQNGHYILRYTDARDNTKELSAQTLDALLYEMRNGDNKNDFTPADSNTVQAQARLIPAMALSDAALNEVKTILTNFYINPNTNTYNAIKEMYALFIRKSFEIGQNMQVFENARNSLGLILEHSNIELARRIFADARAQQNFTVLTTTQQQRLVGVR